MAKVCSFGLGSLKNALSILSALQKNSKKKKSKGNHKVIESKINFPLFEFRVCACVCVCVCSGRSAHKLPQLQVRAAEQLGRIQGLAESPLPGPPRPRAPPRTPTSSSLPQTLGSMFPTPNCAPQRSREARLARTARRAAPTSPTPLRFQRPGIANTHRTGTPPGQSGD